MRTVQTFGQKYLANDTMMVGPAIAIDMLFWFVYRCWPDDQVATYSAANCLGHSHHSTGVPSMQ